MADSTPSSLSEACSFDQVYGSVVRPFFDQLDDQRAFNQSYALSNCLRAGFSLYSLKAPSMLQFRTMTQAEEYNLGSVYGVGPIPSDTQFREVLDGVNPDQLRGSFRRLFDHFSAQSTLRKAYFAWKDYTCLSIDGVEHFCSKKVSCKHCLTRKHRDGSTSHYHSMLSAAIVHPDQAEVFPLDHEPIVKEDGAVKNDCERSAIQRQLNHLEKYYPDFKTILTLDALYSCAPVIRRIEKVAHWRYMIGVKPKGNAYLFEQFDEAHHRGDVKCVDYRDEKGIEWHLGFINGLPLNASAKDVKVNLLYARAPDAKGKELVFSFVTNIAITADNLLQLLSIGRARWKIENETFNTLKNQGYHFKHNYGHGEEHLSTVMAYLMMLAFWVDQLQQAGSDEFINLVRGLKTRVKLWDSLRAVMKIVPMESMREAFIKIADMYCVRLI
ncbi:MAG: transposase [Lewinella sp.]